MTTNNKNTYMENKMDIFLLICGLALFLFGMDVMGNALKKSAGRKLKTILGKLTSNKFMGFILGLGVTAIIQSSSATTVMVVGFVNSGTMLLSQAVTVIMGANVGTAVTAWITALNGIDGASSAIAILKYCKPDYWMPFLALIGIVLIMFAKRDKYKDIGTILMGFAVLMTGMTLMSDGVAALKDNDAFKNLLTIFNNPILGVVAGAVLTAVVQSSSASIGILQALSATGAINFSMAIPIILGQNIGTCITAMLSSLGANKNGKRTAVVHLLFNVIGVTFWLGMYYLVGWTLRLTGAFDVFTLAESSSINMWGIAAIHTIFKILAVALLFPFSKLLEKLACAIVRGEDKKGDEFTNKLDERLLDTPSIAIETSREVACNMAKISTEALKSSISLIDNYDPKVAASVKDIEDKADIYEDVIGSYLVKITSNSMTDADSHEITKLLHMIGDLERISDHAANLVESAEELKDKNLQFSESAKQDLEVLYSAVSEIVEITRDAFIDNNLELAARVEPLEQVVDDLKENIRRGHIVRLQKSECTIEHGFVLSDILTNLERVSDHCSNIAGCLIEMTKNDALDLHGYLHDVKIGSEGFNKLYAEYTEKYKLPTNN